MAIENQVVILYSLVKGYLDDISIDKIKDFEEGLVQYVQRNAKVFLKEIKEKKIWSDKGEEELKKAIEDFKTSFNK